MALDKTILVIGATGGQGGGVARHLLAGGSFHVRAFTRHPRSEAAQTLTNAGAQVVPGDLADPASLRRAVEGCYGVFGVTSYWEHFDREYDHGRALVETVATAGVQHFVFSTQPSVTGPAPHLNVPHNEMKAKLEDYARSLGIPATFVHLAFYFDNFLGFFAPRKEDDGSYVFGFPQREAPLAGVAVADTGGVVARIFEQRDRFLGKTVPVAGDELPPAAYAEILSRVTGWMVRYTHIPREAFARFDFLGAPEVADMFEFYSTHLPSRQPDIALCRTLYPKLQTFEQWAQANRDAWTGVPGG